MPACPLCARSKAKRHCPALDRVICPTCCGTKRQVEIRCPSDCGWLRSARAHPHAAQQRQQEQDANLILKLISDLDDEVYAVLVTCLQAALRHRVETEPVPLDGDLEAAAAALAATAETAARGVLYEHQPDSPVAARLCRAMSAPLADAAEARVPRLDVATAAAMRRLEQAVKAFRKQPEMATDAFFGFLDRALTPRLADADTGQDIDADGASVLAPLTGSRPSDPGQRIIVP